MAMSSTAIQCKIICSEFILSSPITASPHGFIWERHWLSEAVEDTHLPLLPALPQECFSSPPLSPMCRRPLCRVCFACKTGCRCCPQKGPGGTRETGTQGGPTAMPPAWPRLALLPPPPITPLITLPLHPPRSFHPRFNVPPLRQPPSAIPLPPS